MSSDELKEVRFLEDLDVFKNTRSNWMKGFTHAISHNTHAHSNTCVSRSQNAQIESMRVIEGAVSYTKWCSTVIVYVMPTKSENQSLC